MARPNTPKLTIAVITIASIILSMWETSNAILPLTTKVMTVYNRRSDGKNVTLTCSSPFTRTERYSIPPEGVQMILLPIGNLDYPAWPKHCDIDGHVVVRALALPCGNLCKIQIKDEGYFVWDVLRKTWNALWRSPQAPTIAPTPNV